MKDKFRAKNHMVKVVLWDKIKNGAIEDNL